MASLRFVRRVATVWLAAAGFACSAHFVSADELPTIPVIPEQTKVLILPTLDQTGDRPEMQKEHVDFGNHRLEYEFITRHFQVLGPDLAIRAARDTDFDLDDEDSRTKSGMRQLGKLTGADWVVSIAIVEVKSANSRLGNRRAQAKVKLRIFDAKQDGWIADHYFEDHKDSFGVGVGTTGLFRAAIDTTVQRSTATLLDPYALVVKVYDEFGEEDYLAGQTSVFLGDPATAFKGLPPTEIEPAPSGAFPAPSTPAAPDPAPAADPANGAQ